MESPENDNQEEHPYAIHALPNEKRKIIRFNENLPPSVHTILSVGFSRCGKTTSAIQLYSNKKFPFRAAFDQGRRIWLISPTHHVQECWNLLNIPDNQKHNHYDEQVLRDVISEAEQDPNRPRLPRLIIIDDCISELPCSRTTELINVLVYARHLGVSAWCGIQKWSCNLTGIAKANFTSFHVFPQNKFEQDNIYKTVCGDIGRKEFRKMCQLSWKAPFSFLNVDRLLPETNGKYRRCFMEKFCLVNTNDDEFSEIYTKRTGPRTDEENRQATEKQRHRHHWKFGNKKTHYPAQHKSRVLYNEPR